MVEGDPVGAVPVFISYASSDAAVANRLCEMVEQHGIPCWIAPRNVRAGDLYADAIVKAINACRMLVVVLSENSVASSHVLREIERASAKNKSLISLRLDPVSLPPALEYFLSASHWLDASDGNVDRAVAQLVAALGDHLGTALRSLPTADRVPPPGGAGRSWLRPVALGLCLIGALALSFFMIRQFSSARQTAAVSAAAPGAPATAPGAPAAAPGTPAASASMGDPGVAATVIFSPPPHSLAVLPFVNLSGDPKDDYFSDGLSVELLDSLARLRDLQVVARTSSFSFRNKAMEITEIARRLNVGAILEGSIRKDGRHIRIAANLINATTGFRMWSASFDRDLTDILKLQTEIATAVTTALKATLFADTAAVVELGGTRDPQAFDAYLRGERWVGASLDAATLRAQLSAYDEAIRLDPQFAKAYVAKALAEVIFASNAAAAAAVPEGFRQALASARRAVALAPQLGEAHSALGFVLDAGFQDYAAAAVEHERALGLAPGNSRVLLMSARFFSELGRRDAAVANARRAVELDPLNASAYRILGLVLIYTHDYREAVLAYDHALSINPHAVQAAANRGLALTALGDFASAHESCARPPLDWLSHMCLAIVLHKLNRDTEAQAEMAALRASAADPTDQAYQYAEVYAQWGDKEQSLTWLETAYKIRDPGLLQLKVDHLLDPIRHEPRFESLLARMKFPRYTASSAASKSASRSWMCSRPIDRRTVSAETPAFCSSSGESWRCVVDAG